MAIKKATIDLSGIGRVFIETDLREVSFYGAQTDAGELVNFRGFFKVSRDKKHYRAAELNSDAGYSVQKAEDIVNAFFLVKDGEE